MYILISGLIIFFGMHLVPGFVGIRSKLISRLGETTYQGLFAVISLVGFILIIYGKSDANFQPVYEPPVWTVHAAAVLMVIAFVFLASVYMKTNIKRFTAHPMLWGVTFWSCAHLLANGDLASILLFSCFGIYSLYDMYSANKRGATRQTIQYPLRKDVVTIGVALVGYSILMYFHRYLFGLPAV